MAILTVYIFFNRAFGRFQPISTSFFFCYVLVWLLLHGNFLRIVHGNINKFLKQYFFWKQRNINISLRKFYILGKLFVAHFLTCVGPIELVDAAVISAMETLDSYSDRGSNNLADVPALE